MCNTISIYCIAQLLAPGFHTCFELAVPMEIIPRLPAMSLPSVMPSTTFISAIQ